MDRAEHQDFCDAMRIVLDALNAIYVADFDADDSGAMAHVVEEDA